MKVHLAALVWDDTAAGVDGVVRWLPAWHASDRIVQMDALSDWIVALQTAYDALLTPTVDADVSANDVYRTEPSKQGG